MCTQALAHMYSFAHATSCGNEVRVCARAHTYAHATHTYAHIRAYAFVCAQQAAAMRPEAWKGMTHEAQKVLAPLQLMKVSIATYKMLGCWKAKCKARPSMGTEAEQLDLQLLADFGGGAYC